MIDTQDDASPQLIPDRPASAMSTSTKLLVAGSVSGKFSELLTRVQKLQASKAGPFDALLCVGEFCSSDAAHDEQQWQAWQQSQPALPLPTYYITAHNTHVPDSMNDVTDLHQLSDSGIEQIGLLRVAYVSGIASDASFRASADKLLELVQAQPDNPPDVLLTAQLPLASNAPARPSHSPVVGQLASTIPVRYHFAGLSNEHHIAAPYRNSVHVTRFVSMAPVGGDVAGQKETKSLYAVGVQPLRTIDKTQIPEGTVPNPYTAEAAAAAVTAESADQQSNKRQKTAHATMHPSRLNNNQAAGAVDDGSVASFTNRWQTANPNGDKPRRPPPETYVCNRCGQPGHWIKECTAPSTANTPPPGYKCNKCGGTDHYIRECPEIQKERNERSSSSKPPAGYVCKKCDAQEEHYLRQCPLFTQAGKPPVDAGDCWFCLSSTDVKSHLIVSVGDQMYVALPKGGLTADHLLILPIVHTSSSIQLSPEQAAELAKYKQAIRLYFASLGFVTLIFERNIPTRAGQHMHMQCINLLPEHAATAQKVFISEGETQGLKFQVLSADKPLKDVVGDEKYITVELPDETTIYAIVPAQHPTAFDFARRVVATVLNEPEKADWRKCDVGEARETQMCDAVKSRFEKFDFTLAT